MSFVYGQRKTRRNTEKHSSTHTHTIRYTVLNNSWARCGVKADAPLVNSFTLRATVNDELKNTQNAGCIFLYTRRSRRLRLRALSVRSRMTNAAQAMTEVTASASAERERAQLCVPYLNAARAQHSCHCELHSERERASAWEIVC